MSKRLSIDAKSLLGTMKRGTTVLVRATTGRATYVITDHGEHECTYALIELKKAGLVEIEKVDKDVGWVYYKAKEQE